MCIVYAPETFEHDDDGIATVANPAGDSPSSIAAAVEACPVGALSLQSQKKES